MFENLLAMLDSPITMFRRSLPHADTIPVRIVLDTPRLAAMPRRSVDARATNPQRTKITCAAAIGGLLLAFATGAIAGKPTNVTEAEMALLPEYCPDAQFMTKYGDAYTNPSPNAPKWIGLMGQGFWAIHHYCWALINLSRAQKPSVAANVRQSTREYAIEDMKYVIANTPPDFILLPEIYTKIGQVLLLLKRPSEARDAFAKARSLKPDYWPPYYQWGEYLREAGQKAQAREVAEEGLSYSPDAKPLQRLLVSLGGDPASVRPRSIPPAATKDEPDAKASPAPAN